jgi:hypothetical protein
MRLSSMAECSLFSIRQDNSDVTDGTRKSTNSIVAGGRARGGASIARRLLHSKSGDYLLLYLRAILFIALAAVLCVVASDDAASCCHCVHPQRYSDGRTYMCATLGEGRGEGLYLIVSICHGKQMSRVKQLHITYRLYEDSHAEAPHRELPCCWRL